MTETYIANAVELDESKDLDKLVFIALDDASEKLEQSGQIEPFSIVLHNENLHFESYLGEDEDEWRSAASTAISQLAHVMEAYVFAYDGYVDTDEGEEDAIIVERGIPGSPDAEVFALLYTLEEAGDGSLTFDEAIYELGTAPSLLQDSLGTSQGTEE